MKKTTLTFLILTAAISATKICAQSTELGLSAGVSFYSGDISPISVSLYFNELHPAIGIFARVNANKMLSIKAAISQARVSGDDANSKYPDRMLHFRSNITELAITGEFSPFQTGRPRAKVKTAPYLFAGAALYRFNPQALYDGSWIDLQPLGTEGQGLTGYEAPYKLTQIAVPLGLGIKCTFNEAWSLGFEIGARKIFSDHLDDISGAEVNYLDVLTGNGTIAASLSNPNVKEPQDLIYRRGGNFDDWYYITGITLSFRLQGANNRFGRGLGCPNF